MAYQNVGTPVFYMDELSWRKAMGLHMSVSESGYEPVSGLHWHAVSGETKNLFGLDPSNGVEIEIDLLDGNDTIYFISNDLDFPDSQPYHVSVLGHNFKSFNGYYRLDGYVNQEFTGEDGAYTPTPLVNGELLNYNSGLEPQYDGFTIAKYTSYITDRWRFQINPVGATSYENLEDASYIGNLKIGSIVIGGVYEMPHSPDLSLKMSIEMDGVKNIKTKGGVSLTAVNYTKPADWGDRGAWQLGSDEAGQGLSNLRSGRRVWDLSFSYLSSDDIMAKVAATTNLGAGGYEDVENPNENTLLDGTDFFSSVWNRTMGGHLPFIFQPDKDNNNPDQFAICRFDTDSLTYDQVANNVYNVKLKIKESW